MSHVDEGLIHAWLDGELTGEEAARVERLIATDPMWAAVAAEARGLLAGASRILGALDDARAASSDSGMDYNGPGNAGNRRELPADHSGEVVPIHLTPKQRAWWQRPGVRAAAGLVLMVGVASAVWKQTSRDDLNTMPATPVRADSLQGAARTQKETTVVVPSAPEALSLPSSVAARDAAPAKSRNVAPGTSSAAVFAARARGDTLGAGRVSEEQRRVAAVTAVVGGVDSARRRAMDSVSGAVAVAPALARTLPLFERAMVAASEVSADQLVDPRLTGCWREVPDTARVVQGGAGRGGGRAGGRAGRSGAADVRAPIEAVIRFIPPAVTDVIRNDTATPPPQRLSPDIASLNLIARRTDDSTFVADWITETSRTLLVFRVHGDTLRGTRRVGAGDVMFLPREFLALRIVCP
jgi:hypothetical protein